MSRMRSVLLVGLGVAALAIPAGAIASHGGEHGKAKGHAEHGKANGHQMPHSVGYVFKGVYAGEGAVEVKRGNAHVRKGGFFGETVQFDLSRTSFVVPDTNGDGARDAEDVQSGDWVLVKARLPRSDPGPQPFDAIRLIDKSNGGGS